MGISKIKALTSQYHSLGGSRGRGLLCLAPQLGFIFFKSTASSGLGTPDDTAHSGTNDLALIVGAARKRSPSVNDSEKCKRMKLNQSGDFLVCQYFAGRLTSNTDCSSSNVPVPEQGQSTAVLAPLTYFPLG